VEDHRPPHSGKEPLESGALHSSLDVCINVCVCVYARMFLCVFMCVCVYVGNRM